MIEVCSAYIKGYEKMDFTEVEYNSTHQEVVIALTSSPKSPP